MKRTRKRPWHYRIEGGKVLATTESPSLQEQTYRILEELEREPKEPERTLPERPELRAIKEQQAFWRPYMEKVLPSLQGLPCFKYSGVS